MPDINKLRLERLGISVPEAATPIANYITTAKSGKQLFVSGQLPLVKNKLLITGKVDTEVSIENARKAAEVCAINILAQAQAVLGDLSKIKQVTKITVFVATDPGFFDISKIANGASDLFINVLGAAGKHTRSTVGVAVLPMDATVEVEAVLEIRNILPKAAYNKELNL
ncbi:MAG: Endoribonuclease [Candidatus Tokpelaia sp. JSC188]|nr:MAG: Endoribonuclease [Candidatus Tokpelaia sp. JSC188]